MPLVVYFLIGKFFAVFAGFFYFRYLPTPYRMVLYLIAIAFICEGYGYYLGHFLGQVNLWLFNFYAVIEVWLMGMAACYLVTKRQMQIFFITLLVIFSLVWLLYIVLYSIYVYANMATTLGLVFLTFMYIIVLFENSLFNSNNILKQPVFWLAFSTILYCACDIPYVGLFGYLTHHSNELHKQLNMINAVLDIIRYPLAAISFILLGSQKQVVVKTA